MQNDNAKLDKDLAAIAIIALSHIMNNIQTESEEQKAQEVKLKYNLSTANTNLDLSWCAEELIEYFDKTIANIQDKIEEYNALER